MKHEYRITLPLGEFTYARNGVELDRLITDCLDRGLPVNRLTIHAIPVNAPQEPTK